MAPVSNRSIDAGTTCRSMRFPSRSIDEPHGTVGARGNRDVELPPGRDVLVIDADDAVAHLNAGGLGDGVGRECRRQ